MSDTEKAYKKMAEAHYFLRLAREADVTRETHELEAILAFREAKRLLPSIEDGILDGIEDGILDGFGDTASPDHQNVPRLALQKLQKLRQEASRADRQARPQVDLSQGTTAKQQDFDDDEDE